MQHLKCDDGIVRKSGIDVWFEASVRKSEISSLMTQGQRDDFIVECKALMNDY